MHPDTPISLVAVNTVAGIMSLPFPLHPEPQILFKDHLAGLLPVSVGLLLLLNVLFLVPPLNTNTQMFTPPLQLALEQETPAILVSLLTRKLVPLATMFPNITPIARHHNHRLVTLFIVVEILSILPVIMLLAARTTSSIIPQPLIINRPPLPSNNPEAQVIILLTAIIKAT